MFLIVKCSNYFKTNFLFQFSCFKLTCVMRNCCSCVSVTKNAKNLGFVVCNSYC